jgi:hypothetical protein
VSSRICKTSAGISVYGVYSSLEALAPIPKRKRTKTLKKRNKAKKTVLPIINKMILMTTCSYKKNQYQVLPSRAHLQCVRLFLAFATHFSNLNHYTEKLGYL